MSTKSELSLSKKNESMLFVVTLLLGLVAGVVVWKLTDASFLVIIMVMMLVVGIYFLVSMSFVSSNENDFIPSQRSFRLVWGALLTTLGVLGLVYEYGTVDFWILAMILIVVVAIVVLVLYMKGNN
jgi:hypothetical protein